jgi:apolipoprotein N-acyltransferase
MSFLIFLVSSFGVAAYETARGTSPWKIPPSPWTASAGVLAFAIAFAAAAYQDSRVTVAEAKATPLRVALIQDDLEREERLEKFRNDPGGVTERLVAISEAAVAKDPTIEVAMWSEGALRFAPTRRWGASARELTRRYDLEVWTGALTRSRSPDGDPRSYNSAYRIADGAVSAPYHKNVLVPISEALPFADWLPSLPRVVGAIEGAGMLSAGEGVGVYTFAWLCTIVCAALLSRASLPSRAG